MNALRILLTTSRNPTDKMRTFCNDLAGMLPNALRVNRGKMSSEQLAEKALENGAEHVIVVNRWQVGPGTINFIRIGQSGLISIPPIIRVGDIKLRRDFKVFSKVKPVRALAFFSSVPSDEVKKFAEMLAKFFGIPLLSVDELAKKSENFMSLEKDNAERVTVTFMVEPGHVEVGPRITVSKMEW